MSLNSYELSSSYDSGDLHSFSSTNSPWDGQPQPETEDDRSKFADLFAHNHAQQVLDDYREPFLLPTYRAPPNWRPEYEDRTSDPRLTQTIHDPRYDGSKIQLPIHSPQGSNANKSLTHHNNRMAQDLRAILSQPNEVNSLASGTVIYVGPFAALPNLYREQQNIKYYLRSMDGSVRPGGFWSVPNFYITSVRYFLDRNNCRYQIHPDNRSRLKWTLLCAPTENEMEAQKHMVTLGALLLQWCDIFLQSGDFTRLCHALERTEQQISPRMYNQHPTRGPIRPQSRPSVTASSLPVAKVFGDQGPRQREPVRMAFKAAQDFDTLLATRSRAEAMSEFWPGSKILVGAGLRFPRPYEDQQHIHYYHYSFSGEFCWSVPTIYKRYIDQFLQLSHVDYRHIAIGPKYTSYGIASSVKVSKAALFDFGEKLVEWRDLFTDTGGLERLIQALHRRDPPPKWNPMFSALNSSPSGAASTMVPQQPSSFELGPRPPPLPLTYDYQPQQQQLQHQQQPQVDLSSHSMHAAFSTGFGMTHPYREYHHDARALESEDEDRLLREVAAMSLARGLSNDSLGVVALARRCSNEADQNPASASAPAQNIN